MLTSNYLEQQHPGFPLKPKWPFIRQ